MIRKGDTVRIKPQWQDDGDDRFVWIALDDEENGRVTITPITSTLVYKPQYVVRIDMLQ